MNKKQLTVNLIIFFLCLSTAPAFAKNISVRHIIISHHANHARGGEFSKVSANFNTPSFTINSNSGEFSRLTEHFNRSSFSMATQKGEFSKSSVSFH